MLLLHLKELISLFAGIYSLIKELLVHSCIASLVDDELEMLQGAD